MTGSEAAADIEALSAEVRARLDAGEMIRLDVPGGRLHIDRPLPFLCVYRHARGVPRRAAGLVHAQASYLVADGSPAQHPPLARLVSAVVESMAEQFGSVLLIELWTAPVAAGEPPCYRIMSGDPDRPATVDVLAKALAEIDTHGEPPQIDAADDEPVAPPGMAPLLDPARARKLGCLHLGVAVPGVFLDPDSGALYPLLFRSFQQELARAVQHAAFEFAQLQTTFPVEDYRALGRRALVDAATAADARLAELAEDLDFLLAVSPVNVDEAWQQFSADRFEREPVFHYRPLAIDPDLHRRALYALRIEDAEDPTLAALLRAKRKELDELIALLEERGTGRFLLTSRKLFGGVSDELETLARDLLERLGRADRAVVVADGAGRVAAQEFAGRAEAEIRRYARHYPALDATVRVRDDVPGVMVVGSEVIISASTLLDPARVDALLQHEVGTHLVTHVNGAVQPLKLLAVGLPGYMQTQEGLAVLAEHLAGGLTAARLALIAARVLAVRCLLDGAGFVETFRVLQRDVELAPRRAFGVAMRVHRSGGLTKDAMYLAGLDAVLRHLAAGGSVEPLIVGKLSLADVPVVEELQRRGVLRRAPLRPRWLEHAASRQRLESARDGRTVLDLVEGIA